MKNREIAGVKVFVSNDTYDEYKGTLQEQINKLQSNWNSLREFFENGLQSSKTFKESDAIYEDSLMISKVLEVALDKMNELERNDNNE